MKKVIFIITALVSIYSASAQKITPESIKQNDIELNKKIIEQALTYNDAQTAITSMHKIIVLEGATSTYKDSLAITYFNVGSYISSHLLVKELLQTKPDNLQLLEINAASLQNLNAAKEAIEAYEKLFAKTKNMGHGYQLAMLQFGIKRLAEAQITINQTIACEPIEKAYLPFPIDKNQNQNVPLKAAAYNLQGLIAYELKDNKTASEAFAEALKIMPEYVVATQNANAMVVEAQNKKTEELGQTDKMDKK
jgi:tetratricopeptide (TPR) repeat protein